MSIPASQIVTVNPRLLTAGGTDLEFNGLLLTKSDVIPTTQLVIPLSDADSVGEYFGMESDEYQAAVIYFAGYDNSFKKPRALYFGRRIAEDAPAFIRGGTITTTAAQTLAALKAIDAGTLTLTIGATTATTPNINLNGITSLSDAAETIATAINGITEGGEAWTAATVAYSSLLKAFTITSGVAGETAEGAGNGAIDYASGTIADALLLTEAGGAVLSTGMDAMTEAENMEALLDLTENFVCFTTAWQPTETEALAYAQWASGKGVNYLYIYWDNDPKLLQANNTATIAAALTEANVGATCGVYNSLDYAAMIMGTAASIDWDRRNGTITFAFKAQDGLAANVIKGTNATNLIAQNMNFMGDYATRNDQFVFMYPGRMFGSWTWIDTYLNAVWLDNALQVACMSGFEQCPRVPYTEAGYTLIRAWLQDPISRALYSGIIDTGMTLSNSQKAELTREAGRDISGELYTDGYVIQVNDPAPAVRQERESPEVSIWYSYAGSVHRLDVASTALT